MLALPFFLLTAFVYQEQVFDQPSERSSARSFKNARRGLAREHASVEVIGNRPDIHGSEERGVRGWPNQGQLRPSVRRVRRPGRERYQNAVNAKAAPHNRIVEILVRQPAHGELPSPSK